MSFQTDYFNPIGILDGTKSEEFQATISQIIEKGAQGILIDLKEVTFMDSSGLGCLVLCLKNARSAGVTLYLCSLNEQIKMLFELTSMDNAFEIFSDRQEFEEKVLGI